MHRHDLDLIAALADGSLEDEDRARALMDECDLCRAEYDSQRSVIERLGALAPVSMSDAEKARLHREVLTGLTQGAREDVTSRRRSPWMRWVYAAAGVFVVAGLVGAVTQLGGLNAGDGSNFGEDVGSPVQGLGEVDGGGSAEVTTSTAREGEDGTPPEEGGDDAWQPLVDRTREMASPNFIAEYADNATAEEALACIEHAGLDRSDYRIVGTVTQTSPYLLVVPTEVEFDSSTPVTVVDFDNCEVLAVDD